VKKTVALIAVLIVALVTLPSALVCNNVVFPQRLDDAKAVYLTPDRFPVHGDGVADDSEAVQKAIDQIQETTHQGILFIPSGHYRITRTIYVWPGIRLIGYGAQRPVFELAKNTSGFSGGYRL